MRLLPRVLAVALLLTVLVHATPAHAATRPSAPRSVTATPLDRAVKVSWAAPASTGGSRITAYAVQRRNSTSAAWVTVKFTAGGARAWTETGLVNGRRFYYRVLARNAVGTGTPSPQVSAVPRTVPAAVRFFEADNYDRALGAYWPAPASNGAAIDGYRVELSTDGATWTTARTSRVAASRTAPLKFTGLTPGGRYWLRIRPHNAAGYGPASGSGPYRAYTVPDAVGALTATPGDGTAALTWTAPVADPGIGRPAATSYVVERAVGATWAPVGTTTATGLVVGDLANGAEHVLRVRAFSAFAGIGGSLPATTTVQLAPGVVAPGAPLAPALAWSDAEESHVLSWQPPADDGGRAIDHYEVQWSGATPGSSHPADTRSVAVGDEALAEAAQVRACNSSTLCGPWTAPVGPLTGPVTGLLATQATAGTVRTVHLAWSPPANGLATSYEVARSTDGGASFEVLDTTSAPSYDDQQTAPSTAYVYRVVPSGGTGPGAPRTTAITTTADQALTISPATVTVTEGAGTLAQVVLAAPTSVATVVTLATTDPATAVTTSATATVPAGGTTASLTVQGTPDDDVADGTTTLTASLGTLQASATVQVSDDDSQAMLAPASATVADGSTVALGVRLAFRPAGPVTVSVGVTQNGNRVSVAPTTLVFTASDWDVAQQVQVTGQMAGSATVTLSAPGATSASTQVTVTP